MKKISLNIIKIGIAYSVLAKYGDTGATFKTRDEDTAYSVFNFAQKILAKMEEEGAPNIEACESDDGDFIIMAEFENLLTLLTLHIEDKRDGADAAEFIEKVIELAEVEE